MDRKTREEIAAFAKKMNDEGAAGFAAGPTPWDTWDDFEQRVGSQAPHDIETPAASEPVHRATKPVFKSGERMLTTISVAAVAALALGVTGVYLSREPAQQLAQTRIETPPQSGDAVATNHGKQDIALNQATVPAAPAPVESTPAMTKQTGIHSSAANSTAPLQTTSASGEPNRSHPPPASDGMQPNPESAVLAVANMTEPTSIDHDEPGTAAQSAADPRQTATAQTSPTGNLPRSESSLGKSMAAAATLASGAGLSGSKPPAITNPRTTAPAAVTAPGTPASNWAQLPAQNLPGPTQTQTARPDQLPTNPIIPADAVAPTALPDADSLLAALNSLPPPSAGQQAAPATGADNPAQNPPEKGGDTPAQSARDMKADVTLAQAHTAKTPPASAPDNSKRNSKRGPWSINLASFTRQKIADEMRAQYLKQGVTADKVIATINGRTFYRLRITGFDSKQAALNKSRVIKDKLGLTDAWITKK